MRCRYRNMKALYLALVELSRDFDRNERYTDLVDAMNGYTENICNWDCGVESGKGLFLFVIKDCTQKFRMRRLSLSLSHTQTHTRAHILVLLSCVLWPNRVNAGVHLLSVGSFHSICTRLVAKRFMQFW